MWLVTPQHAADAPEVVIPRGKAKRSRPARETEQIKTEGDASEIRSCEGTQKDAKKAKKGPASALPVEVKGESQEESPREATTSCQSEASLTLTLSL